MGTESRAKLSCIVPRQCHLSDKFQYVFINKLSIEKLF